MSDMDDTEIEIEVNEDLEETEVLDETAAADSLKPMGAPGESKAVMLATFTQMLSQLGQEDLSYLFNQVQGQYGPNAALTADGNSAKNQGTLKPGSMPVKEEVEEMFGADEDLSEDFKERAEVIFEAALNTRLVLERASLEEEFEAREAELVEELEEKLEATTAEIFEELGDKLDQYLGLVVENWMADNQLAIDNGLRAEIAEDFITGLHTLFSEHYIKVPESELDIVAEMKDKIESLEEQLNAVIDEKLELQEVASEAIKSNIVEELTEGLTLPQAEKMRTLAEGIEFTDGESFSKKLNIIKENYFTKKTIKPTGLIVEEAEEAGERIVEASGVMKHYADAISKSVKK